MSPQIWKMEEAKEFALQKVQKKKEDIKNEVGLKSVVLTKKLHGPWFGTRTNKDVVVVTGVDSQPFHHLLEK